MIATLLYLGIIADHAHLASPVVTAWSNSGFRKYMLQRPEKFILIPVALIVFSILFGLEVPFSAPAFKFMVGVSLLWNSYHFGMQNFGLMALRGQREVGFILLCATMFGMSVLPLTPWGGAIPAIIIMGIVSWAHWLTDIGLSTFISRHRVIFLAIIFVLAPLGLIAKHVNADHVFHSSIPVIVSVRSFGMGFLHFLYSRWVWKFSDPQVRATIGKELFA